MADAFGGPIPLAELVGGSDDEVGAAVVTTLTGHRSTAVLLRQRGLFAVGASAREAVRSLVLGEDAARAVHLASLTGAVAPLPEDLVDLRWGRRAG